MTGAYPQVFRGLHAYCDRFACSYDTALLDLAVILRRDEALGLRYRDDTRGDILITCELCRDDAWWQANYGALWQAAQWWHCGPFGLDCP